jgi:hypothetical protein
MSLTRPPYRRGRLLHRPRPPASSDLPASRQEIFRHAQHIDIHFRIQRTSFPPTSSQHPSASGQGTAASLPNRSNDIPFIETTRNACTAPQAILLIGSTFLNVPHSHNTPTYTKTKDRCILFPSKMQPNIATNFSCIHQPRPHSRMHSKEDCRRCNVSTKQSFHPNLSSSRTVIYHKLATLSSITSTLASRSKIPPPFPMERSLQGSITR